MLRRYRDLPVVTWLQGTNADIRTCVSLHPVPVLPITYWVVGLASKLSGHFLFSLPARLVLSTHFTQASALLSPPPRSPS